MVGIHQNLIVVQKKHNYIRWESLVIFYNLNLKFKYIMARIFKKYIRKPRYISRKAISKP